MRSLACPERRVVLGLGVCLVLALALPGALAASTPQPSQAAWALTPSPAIAGPFTRGDAAWRRGQRAERARIAALHSGGARRARRQSRSRFGKLHRKEVVRLARRTFPIQTRARLFDGSAPGAGARVVEQRHGRTGLVKDANGTTSLLTSSLPLETKAEDGTYAPVDLSLVTRDKVLRTANSLAPLEISREGAGRVALPESGGLAFELQGADSRSAQVVANRAYFADVATDTDEVVTPTPTGAELSLQIRSAAAPERFVFHAVLPPGAVLRRASVPPSQRIPNDEPASLEVALHGTPLAYIHPPIAYDAQLRSVETTMAIDGDDIVMRVEHHGRDLMYPLLADPEVHHYSDYNLDWPGWVWGQVLYGNSGSCGSARNLCAYYCGLYQSHPTNTFITDTSYAHWSYRSRENTFLYRVRFGGMAHDSVTLYGRNHTNWYNGIINSTYSAWESPVDYVNGFGNYGGNPFGPAEHDAWGVDHDYCFKPRCDSRAGSEQNYALFAFQTDNKFREFPDGLNPGGDKGTNTLAWATVYLGDRRYPTLTGGLPADTPWRDDGFGETTVTPRASDEGLGIYAFDLAGAATGNGAHTLGCTGNPHYLPCPTDGSKPIRYRLGDGATRLHLSARDAVDNATWTHSWLERIDRSEPVVGTPTGTLYAARNRTDDRRHVGLYNASYTLSATATDAGSGVREVEIFVDGESQRPTGGYAAGGTVNWTMRPDDFADGTYTVEIVARDNLQGQPGAPDDRHVGSRSFTVTVDRKGDIFAARQVTGSTADGGVQMAREWSRYGTPLGRIDTINALMTRTIVACDPAQPDGAKCAEVRQRPRGESGALDPDMTTTRSNDPEDERLDTPGEAVAISRADLGDPAARGTLNAVVPAWQAPPPTRGTEYVRYDDSEYVTYAQGAQPPDSDQSERPESRQLVVTQIYLDAKTRLPVRQRRIYPDGTEENLYWSYDVGRLELSQVASTHFRQPKPTAPESDRQVEFTGATAPGPTTDQQTQRSFRGYSFGRNPVLPSGTFCLATGVRFSQVEQPQADLVADPDPDALTRPLSSITRVQAEYRAAAVGACTPGVAHIDVADYEVLSSYKDSNVALVLKEQMTRIAQAVQLDPTDADFLRGGLVPVTVGLEPEVAYVVPVADRVNSLVVDIGNTTVQVIGPFDKTDAEAIVDLLEEF